MPKLYELKRDKGIEIHGLKIGINGEEPTEQVVIFGHIDGAYSYCWIKGNQDAIVHLNASTELEHIKKDQYKVK